jgi:hypothetical protein
MCKLILGRHTGFQPGDYELEDIHSPEKSQIAPLYVVVST